MMTVLCIILGYLLDLSLLPGNWQTLLQDRYPPIWFRKSRWNKCRTRSRKESWYFGYRSRCLKSCLSCRSCILGQVNQLAIWTSLACCIGHCYPIFAHFKGGKAVTTMFGFLISTSIFIFQEFSYFLVPLFMFLIILYLFKYVSLGSICASVCSSLYITAQLLSLDVNNLFIILASWLMTLLVIYRHSANIKRIQEGTENKVSWL